MKRSMLLRSPDPVDPSGSTDQNQPAPSNDTPPPAAKTVINGTKSEREIILEEELQAERARRTKTESEKQERERTINELQDQLRALQTPSPRPAVNNRSALERFMAGEEVD